MGIHELIAAGPVAVKRLRLLVAQVECPARFPTRQHIKRLARKRIERSHFAAGINLPPQSVQLREQFLAALQSRQIHLPR